MHPCPWLKADAPRHHAAIVWVRRVGCTRARGCRVVRVDVCTHVREFPPAVHRGGRGVKVWPCAKLQGNTHPPGCAQRVAPGRRCVAAHPCRQWRGCPDLRLRLWVQILREAMATGASRCMGPRLVTSRLTLSTTVLVCWYAAAAAMRSTLNAAANTSHVLRWMPYSPWQVRVLHTQTGHSSSSHSRQCRALMASEVCHRSGACANLVLAPGALHVMWHTAGAARVLTCICTSTCVLPTVVPGCVVYNVVVVMRWSCEQLLLGAW